MNHAADIDNDSNVAMEVGMQSAIQCLEAANAGLEAHCFEPSPNSFERVKKQVEKQDTIVRDLVTIDNRAASGTSEGTVDFKSSGGTCDHVGEFDMWRMKKMTANKDMKDGKIVQMPQVRLDDIVGQIKVFSGLSESLRHHKIKFILMEYWPRGMDLHADNHHDACVAADLLSNTLVRPSHTVH